MIPGESSSPEPPIPISNDSVDSLQVSMQRTRIAPATFVPINFADWADIEPEPIDSTAATHSNRGSNDLLPVTTNIPENEREVDVEGANLQVGGGKLMFDLIKANFFLKILTLINFLNLLVFKSRIL